MNTAFKRNDVVVFMTDDDLPRVGKRSEVHASQVRHVQRKQTRT